MASRSVSSPSRAPGEGASSLAHGLDEGRQLQPEGGLEAVGERLEMVAVEAEVDG